MTWTPRDEDPETFHTLVDGVPDWIRSSIERWLVSAYTQLNLAGDRVRNPNRMRRYCIASRNGKYETLFTQHGPSLMFKLLDDDELLNFIEWTVYDNSQSTRLTSENLSLDRILSDGGSKWKIGTRDGLPGLEQRVPEGVQLNAEQAMNTPGNAGKLLAEAWHATYGINPNPELGYSKAVKAVEAAARPLVSPKNATATLGNIVGQMRADKDWDMVLIKKHPQNPTDKVLIDLMQALWSGQRKRHGDDDTQEIQSAEAETAVSLAVTLVNLFAGNLIQRSSETTSVAESVDGETVDVTQQQHEPKGFVYNP